MPSINKVILIGHIGMINELRVTKTGKKVINFTVATNKNDNVTWHNIVAWDKLAEMCNNMHKGNLVYIEGCLNNNKWQDSENNIKYKTEINAFIVYNLRHKKTNDAESESQEERSDNGDLPF